MNAVVPRHRPARLLALIAVLSGLLVFGGLHLWRNSDAGLRQSLDAAVAKEPSLALTLGSVKRNFPEDYERIAALLTSSVRSGGGPDSAYATGFLAMQRLVNDNLPNIARAPTPELVRYAQTQSAAIETLARLSPELCAKVAAGTLSATDRPPRETWMSSGRVTAAALAAARAGIDRPVQRATGPITEAEGEALTRALQRGGISPELLAVMRSPEGAAGAPPTQQCEATRAMSAAIASLPPEQAARWTAALLTGGA